MSVEYYAKIERGGFAGVSPAILHAIARALRLDAAERAHMLHLAEASEGTGVLLRPRRAARTAPRHTTSRPAADGDAG